MDEYIGKLDALKYYKDLNSENEPKIKAEILNQMYYRIINKK